MINDVYLIGGVNHTSSLQDEGGGQLDKPSDKYTPAPTSPAAITDMSVGVGVFLLSRSVILGTRLTDSTVNIFSSIFSHSFCFSRLAIRHRGGNSVHRDI